VLFDVTARREAEEVVRAGEAEVRRSLEVLEPTDDERRRVLRHLIAAEAEDRGRLAEGIEDRSLQDFAVLGLRLETLRRGLDDPDQLGAIERLGEAVEQARARLRHLLVELRPRELETDGLGAALEQYVRAVAPRPVRATVRDAVTREPEPAVRGLAYRIAQDAVVWAFERVGEGEVAVDVETDGEGTLVRLRCDPRVIEPADEDDPTLVSMRERAEVAGGWVRLRLAADGTALEFWLPGRLAGGP
jgi:signal transduction histidine kinase